MTGSLTASILPQLAEALSGSQTLEEGLILKLASTIRGDVCDEDTVRQVLEMLADAARQVEWRDIFGQAGLLATCSHSLHPEEPENTLKQKLRLIGNCCADNDSNRDIVIETECYEKLTCVTTAALPLQPLVMVVIFNFMNEYEPAQRHAFKHGLVDLVTKILHEEDKNQPLAIEYALRCLELVLQSDIPLGDKASGLITLLLGWATYPTIQFDIFYIILSCLLALHKEEYTEAFNSDPSPVLNYIKLMARLQYWEDQLSNDPELPDEIDKEDVTRLIRGSRSSTITTVSEISASESFQDQFPTGSAFLNSIVQLLASSDSTLLTCAALILGNMARDPETCDALIREYQPHLSLVNVLKEQTQIGVLHAVGGALKNLVIGSPAIRESVIQAGILQYCHKFYLASVMVEVQHMGLSLIRILVAASPGNAECLFLPLEHDASLSAIEHILQLYAKNTEVPIRMEIGRIVVSILREAAKLPSTHPTRISLQHKTSDMSPLILEPVIDMLIQDKWPVVASEGWFALALCVQTPRGASAVADLTLPERFFQVLRQAIYQKSDRSNFPELTPPEKPRPGPEHLDSKASTQSQKDRENALMFLSGFLKHNTSEAPRNYTTLLQRFLDGQEVTDVLIKETLGVN
ncbi:hypothetical protein TWF679_004498 [Orbilia oligospora]|uniref:Uncharacterized protein n=1 Tax=Orbilia oligospora TaxID=2813651 RepID=A0A8H8UQ81_ORBOL|nr:hypothetical protein TWF679_004498 [Orbilia oligospora]